MIVVVVVIVALLVGVGAFAFCRRREAQQAAPYADFTALPGDSSNRSPSKVRPAFLDAPVSARARTHTHTRAHVACPEFSDLAPPPRDSVWQRLLAVMSPLCVCVHDVRVCWLVLSQTYEMNRTPGDKQPAASRPLISDSDSD